MTTVYHALSSSNFSQNWTHLGTLITAANDWSGVPSIVGYRGDDLTTATGTDPQTILANGSATPQSATLLDANTASTTGAVGIFSTLANPTVALQGSGTADAPHIVVHLDATGRQNIVVSYTLRDIDATTDNAAQAVALQYRLGNSGDFINLPAAYVADASSGPSLTLDTPMSVTLPAAANGAAQLQLRFITANAVGNDEWIGIDDLSVTSSAAPVGPSLAYTGSLNESQTFDGHLSAASKITVTLSGDTFTGSDGASLLSAATVTNVPAGLVAVLTRTSATTAELGFTGSAASHASDINNLTVTFADGAFTGGSAASVTNATKNNLKIDFAELGAASSTQTFTPNTGTTQGSSDASTALALDANWMVVGDDEASVLRVYNREGGAAVKEWNYGTALGNGGELDLEAGTRIGDTFYFTGSHSNNKSGAEQNNREYILAVKIEGTGADTQFTYLGKHTGLEDQLVAWDQGNAHGKGANYFGFAASSVGVIPENVNGFSIEGMTASQDGTKLLVAFRAPQTDANTRDKAVVLELAVAGLVDASGGSAPNVSAVHELNLGGRGIRSIEKAGDGSYLILAGPSGGASTDVTNDFRLFRWDGVSATPTELDVNLDALRDSTGGSFETIVDVQSTAQGTLVQLLQDNGDSTWGGATASKDLPAAQQKFVGNWVQIGGNVIDSTGPVLASSTPADDAGSVGKAADIVLRFNEGVARGSGDFVIKKLSDNSVVATIAATDTTQVTVAFNTVTINPASDLEVGTAYYVEAAAGTLKDHYGNSWAGLSGNAQLNFTTSAAPLPKLLITEVNSNATPGDFFELYNYGSEEIDLSGWTWTDSAADPTKLGSFAAGTKIAAGGKLVVAGEVTDATAFKAAWGLDANTAVVAVGGPGLGKGDGVVVLTGGGQVAAAINYSGTAFTNNGTSVAPMAKTGGGTVAGSEHAGAAFGGTATTSAVWDGLSTTNPTYKAAVAGELGAFAQTGTPANIGSPGALVVAQPKLLITEVNSNATPGDFFELYNYGNTEIDLSGWKWTDSAADPTKLGAFANGTKIPAGGKLVVAGEVTDTTAFKAAWGLDANTAVVAVGGPGLGKGDGVVILDGNGQVATAINYSGTAFTNNGTSVAPMAKTGGGTVAGSEHAGVAFGGTATTSAVWDGVSTTNPTYKAAAVGQLGAFAQTGTPANVGSPGLTEASKGAVPTYTQAFNDANGFAEFTKFSKDADAVNSWYLNSTAGADKAAEVNGFGDTAAANDWLISKAFNLNDTSVEFLSFRTWTNFTDNGFAQPVTLKYSTNYSGTGDPALATWTDLSFTPSPQGSQAWTNSGPIDLSGIVGTNVYFAFQYQASGTAASSSSSWRVDDFKLESYSGPVVSIAATSADKVEGNAGTTAYTFTVTRAGDTSGVASMNWAVTGSGTSPATADDFVGNALPSGSVSFAAGETSKLITVNVQGDTAIEQDEGFTVTLSGVPNGTTVIGGGTAQGVIRTDEAPITKIHAIQGSSDTAQMMGSAVTIEGIVTGYAPNLQGFYVQEEAADYDNDASTSEGIFVYYGNTAIAGLDANSIGDKIRIKGTVADYKGQTQLTGLSGFTLVQADAGVPDATVVTLPVASAVSWEAYEGMLVTVQSGTANGGKLVVTDNYNLGQYGQVTLTSDAVQSQYTELHAPSVSGNTDYLAELKKDQIILDDLNGSQNPASHIGRGGQPLSAANTLRAGDSVTSVTGIVDQFVDTAAAAHETSYRVQPTQAVNFTGDARPTVADIPACIRNAEIKVGSANVLNYFTTLGTANFNTPDGVSQSGRGATNATELARQQAKVVENLVGMDADVLGLMEVQNNGFGDGTSALDSLVDALNAKAGAGTYAYVKAPYNDGAKAGDAATAGTDAIMVAIVYKPGKVTPVGQAAVADPTVYTAFSAAFGSRVPVAQTFKSNADNEEFTVVVNHFKSKGSVLDADIGDGQGANNLARVKAAEDLSAWLATKPTGTTDGDVLLVGDFNAYAKEDPITKLAANGYTKVSTGNSYSFDGLWGSLDHALASGSLASQVSGTYKWGINAEEPAVLDYNMENKSDAQDASYFNADPYRSSDHNPILIGLNLSSTPASGGGGGGGTPTTPTIPVIPPTAPGEPATLQGSSGNDTIVVPDLPLTRVVTGGGADTVTGGSGVDTVVVSATLADVLRLGISQDSSGKVVINTPTGPVTMSGVERVELQGSLFAFDVALPSATSEGGKTGQMLALAYTIFGQKPDTAALSQWVHKADSLGGGLDALAQSFIDALAPGIGNDGLVSFLFQSVTGVAPTAQQVQEFASLIGPGKAYATQGAFLAAVAKLPIATEGLAELVGVVQPLDAAVFL